MRIFDDNEIRELKESIQELTLNNVEGSVAELEVPEDVSLIMAELLTGVEALSSSSSESIIPAWYDEFRCCFDEVLDPLILQGIRMSLISLYLLLPEDLDEDEVEAINLLIDLRSVAGSIGEDIK